MQGQPPRHAFNIGLLKRKDVAALQVSTKDGALLLRHNLTLDDSTTIGEHPEFADKRSLC